MSLLHRLRQMTGIPDPAGSLSATVEAMPTIEPSTAMTEPEGQVESEPMPTAASASAPALLDEEIPRYPPFLKGLPLPPLERLIATQSDLIARLRRELALGDDEDDGSERWATYIAPVIRRYAAFVHLIPASEVHHHRGAGGLYRHGLEVAFYAARASRGVMVGLDRPRVEQRRLEPRLRAAAALGGLLHDSGKALVDVAATDRDGRTTWSPIDEDLADWAARQGLERYFLHWREQRDHNGHEVFNLIALKRLLPSRVERWLSQPDPGLYSGLVAAVTGVPHSSVLVELVRQADRHSVERDLREQRIAPIDTAVGVPVDRYLLDAMRRLLHDGRWQVNVPGARVWLLRGAGLHLVWPAAARDITELLAAERIPGIPRDPQSIAELLFERGLAVARVDAVGRQATWRLAPALLSSAGAKPILLNLLRLQSPELLFPHGAPAAVDLVARDEQSEAGVGVTSRSEAIAPEADRAGRDEVGDLADVARAGESAAAGSRVSDLERGDDDASDLDSPLTSSNGAQRPHRDSEEGTLSVLGASAPASGSAPATALASASVIRPPTAVEQDPSHNDACAAARVWLTDHGPGSAQLMAQLLDAAPSAAHEHQLAWRDDLLWLSYPDWFKATGWEPTQAAESLSAEGALEPDPRTPMRRVREHGGERWLVLTAEVSARLRLLVEAANSSQTAVEPNSETSAPSAVPLSATTAPAPTSTSTSTPRPTAALIPPSPQTSPNLPATASGQGTAEQNPRVPANPEAPPDKPPLIPAILADLDRQHGPSDGSQVLVLDSTALKALAKRHGLGVYSLRQRLLTDPRFRLGAHQRIEVQR
ncbi:MobH family relaxase [Lamprobacter modestohalophilus]|uniref:MobH family relaxase n=1 Tax=Lamprobacter modestohalophilus TaxID=1064514 RepID=UPI002ADEDF8F|nr:MobH family relaxase [Lamprobacter modestohalophilus]MEA1052988.1 MobH family relaxase [Lamprobacter modestohalophilus]